ncbi:MAG: NPCBM/NEW2 domain-containing protein [Phycisphaerae bacterium]
MLPDSWNKACLPAFAAIVAGTMGHLIPIGHARAADLVVTTIEGRTIPGQYAGITDDGLFQVDADGPLQQIDLDDLQAVEFTGPRPATTMPQLDNPVVFHFAPRGLLHAVIVGWADSGIDVRTAFSQSLTLALDRLQAVRLAEPTSHPQADELFQTELSNRLPGKDVLITRAAGKSRALRGRLTFLDAEQGGLIFGDRERTFQLNTLYGIVFAKGTSPVATDNCLVDLAQGDHIPGRLVASDTQNLHLQFGQGQTLTIPIDRVRHITQRSRRVAYLSDLTPTRQDVRGIIHDPWPVRFDRSVSNQLLTLGGRTFDKGIGVHARTKLIYTLGGAYERFCATIGIDDAVRPRGHVLFRLVGDGRTIFDSGRVDGSQPPREVSVNVAGIDRLTLRVDYGQQADLADHADWADARLIKPRSTARCDRAENTAP